MSNKVKSNSDKVSIALSVSLVGLALLLVLSFLGDFVKSGDMGIGLLKSLLFSAIFAFLLWLMKYAKTRESDLKKWRIVEWVTLGSYLIVVILSIFLSGLPTFVSVNTDKENLKESARADVQSLQESILSFKSFENEMLENTVVGLKNVVGHSNCSQQLQTYINQNKLEGVSGSLSVKSIESFRQNMSDDVDVISVDNAEYYQRWMDMISQCSATIESWNMFKLQEMAADLSTLGNEISVVLPEFSKQNNFPTISNHDGVYDLDDDSKIYQCEFSLKFSDQIQSIKGISIWSIIVVLLVHFLVLFSYIFCFRSNRVEIGRGQDSSNMPGHLLRNE